MSAQQESPAVAIAHRHVEAWGNHDFDTARSMLADDVKVSALPLNGTSPLRIGTRDCGSFFTGGLDEVAVFDRRLTAAEISDLHTRSQ